mgnify:CR=1 FL=1
MNRRDLLKLAALSAVPASVLQARSAFAADAIELGCPVPMSGAFAANGKFADLGMKLAFSDQANFKGMTTKTQVLISNVIHKAFIEVNEEGSEAAAATAVLLTKGAMPERPRRAEFTADRPFVYLLQDLTTGATLFVGQLADPTKS